MGKKNKLQRFAENETFENMFQPRWDDVKNGFFLKGKWSKAFFKNNNPICLELGCGKGEYTVGLARKYPNVNFIGIDIKGARMWKGCKTSNIEGLNNVAFIRTKIQQIELFFDKAEINEIWITFPDPQPKNYQERKRLTSTRFLDRYRNILTKNALIHLKTDNLGFFEYTLEVIDDNQHKLEYKTFDLYNEDIKDDVMDVQTYYESLWLEQGLSIKYLRFRLNG